MSRRALRAFLGHYLMQLMTVSRAQPSGNNLVHDLGQIIDSHVMDIIRRRSGKAA